MPEIFPILEMIKSHDMVLATGHISTAESMALVAEARNMGIHRVVVTHGTTMSFWTGMTLEDMKELAAMGAFIEHCMHVVMPTTHRMDPKDLAKTISAIGPEKCILSTDFGQDFPPDARRGYAHGHRHHAAFWDGRGGSWHAGQGQPLAPDGDLKARGIGPG